MTLYSQGKSARTMSHGVVCTTEDTVETLYTCPSNCRSEVTMLYCVNPNGNTSALSKWVRFSDSAEFTLIGGKNLTTGESVLLTGATLVLEPGDKITCVASGNTTPELDYMCTVTETFIPIG